MISVTTPRVPFNRDALVLIRKGASAAELGWSESFYVRICREHGVQPHVATKPAASVQPSDAVGAAMAALLHTPWPQGERRTVVFECFVAGRPRRFTRAVGRDQAKMFAMLATRKDEKITGTVLHRECGYQVRETLWGTVARHLRTSLIGTPLDLDGRKGTGGGYRIISAATQRPIPVKLISIGDLQFDVQVESPVNSVNQEHSQTAAAGDA